MIKLHRFQLTIEGVWPAMPYHFYTYYLETDKSVVMLRFGLFKNKCYVGSKEKLKQIVAEELDCHHEEQHEEQLFDDEKLVKEIDAWVCTTDYKKSRGFEKSILSTSHFLINKMGWPLS